MAKEMPLAEALRIVVDIAGGNKDVWYGQVDVKREKIAMAAAEKHADWLKSLGPAENR